MIDLIDDDADLDVETAEPTAPAAPAPVAASRIVSRDRLAERLAYLTEFRDAAASEDATTEDADGAHVVDDHAA